MSEKEKKIIEELADKLPVMSERERGYLEGTIATAAAMSRKKEEAMDKKDEAGEEDVLQTFNYTGSMGTWWALCTGHEKNRTRQQDISCVGSVRSISFHWVRVV